MKSEIKKEGIINLKHGEYEYPITYKMILDGRKNKILHKKMSQRIILRMIHGNKDKSVPLNYSRKVLKIFDKVAKSNLSVSFR